MIGVEPAGRAAVGEPTRPDRSGPGKQLWDEDLGCASSALHSPDSFHRSMFREPVARRAGCSHPPQAGRCFGFPSPRPLGHPGLQPPGEGRHHHHRQKHRGGKHLSNAHYIPGPGPCLLCVSVSLVSTLQMRRRKRQKHPAEITRLLCSRERLGLEWWNGLEC